MNDERLARATGQWLRDIDSPPIDPLADVRQAMAQVRVTGQVRRSWRFAVLREEAHRPTATDTTEHQPSPIPATNGHTPTAIGRTQSMLSPVTAVTAGVLVFAIGSVMLVAQPFDQQGSNVPRAATVDPAMAPSFFTGTFEMDPSAESVTERRDDGVVEGTGESHAVAWDANDPRISGTGTYILNGADYREGATTLADTGDVGTIWTGLLRIANDDGAWEGALQHLYIPNSDWSNAAGWLTGTGDYEGLRAYVVWWDLADEVHGHITAEGPPPVPESTVR